MLTFTFGLDISGQSEQFLVGQTLNQPNSGPKVEIWTIQKLANETLDNRKQTIFKSINPHPHLLSELSTTCNKRNLNLF